MLIRREDGPIEMAWDVEGIQGISHASSEDQSNVLISVCNLKANGVSAQLEAGGTYSLWRVQDSVEFRIAIFYVVKNLASVRAHDYILVVMGEYDEYKSALLDAWSDGVSVNWSDLGVQCGDAWLSLCRELASKNNWIQRGVNETLIALDAEGLRSEQDLYCRLGESFFGYRGYAGTNLDALYDVLRENDLKCEIVFKNKAHFSFVCEGLTKDVDYFRKLIQAMLDAGLRVAN